jgi:hypothetical protein
MTIRLSNSVKDAGARYKSTTDMPNAIQRTPINMALGDLSLRKSEFDYTDTVKCDGEFFLFPNLGEQCILLPQMNNGEARR